MNVVDTRLALFAALLSLAVASSAFASPPLPQKTAALPTFDEMDKDKDGIVTLTEIMVYPDPVAKVVKSCDGDHDEKLTREEYASCKAAADYPVKPAK